jgi:hypothetical protein
MRKVAKRYPKPSPEEGTEIRAGIALDQDDPEWTEKDFTNAVPFSGSSEAVQKAMVGKEKVTIYGKNTFRFTNANSVFAKHFT